MPQKLTSAAIGVLQNCVFDDMAIRFPQVDPTLYNEINEVIVRLGGKWKGGRTRAHVFQEEPAPLIQFVLSTGTMPPKNPEAFYPTPDKVAHGVMAMAELDKLLDEDLILEPQAGNAALLDYLQAHAKEFLVDENHAPLKPRIHLIEKAPLRCAILRAKGYLNVQQQNFLQYQTDLRFARILMNPPFSVPGSKTAYIDHILHAFTFLTPGGVLTAVAPDHFIRHEDQRSQSFLEFITSNGYFETNDPHAFKETGATVQTVTIALEKPTAREIELAESEPYQNYLNYYCFLACLRIDNEPHLYDRATQLIRKLNDGHLGLNLLGEPDHETRDAIEDLYRTAIHELRKIGSNIKMKPAWMNWLVSTFLAEHSLPRTEQLSLRAA
jgi:hypothetical protein